jgi:glycosyltransferase involved in cell wall biosynthesis
MTQSPQFNYIITIHNKEDLIEQVIMSILACCRDNSHIYAVLDGCTDKTEAIIDGVVEKFANVPITKIYTPDVHEILSINAGLRVANQEGIGYNIILQDDVLLADFMLEKKVVDLYEWAGPQLGLVSFRHGANFIANVAMSSSGIPLQDYVENAYGHGSSKAQVLLPGQFSYRAVCIKSPICIPCHLIRTVGMMEERLAPYMLDDVDYSIRCLRAGFRNAVFAVRFVSDIKWGGTRVTPHPNMGKISERNMYNILKWHRDFLERISSDTASVDIATVPGCEDYDRTHAINAWEDARSSLNSYAQLNQSNIKVNAKLLIKKLLRLITHEKA